MSKKKLIGKMDSALTALLFVLLLPLIFTIFFQKMQIEQLLGDLGTAGEDADRIAAVVANEISANAPAECLKAQAVIARTNLAAADASGTEAPDEMSEARMRELWGENFSEVLEKIKEAVTDTAGETLRYQGAYIYAAYHAVSAGNTRSMKELYPESEMPYLTGVACHDDCSSDDYLAVYYWDTEKFLEICRSQFPDAVLTDFSEVSVLEKDSAGYVLSVRVGDQTYDGETFRAALGLSSAAFALSCDGENVRIVTKGLGHGFGLSQYTAEKMAEDGSTYEEILNYFFPGAKLQKE